MTTNQADNDDLMEQSDASSLLETLRERAFDSSNEKLALALGRPTEEIEAWFEGTEPIDDDVVMKARGIAQQRAIEV